MDSARQVLKDVFGFPSFRLSQEAVISRLIEANNNALVIFPTGGGKSLTYQVPALCLEGITLVISPLIALMKDQVNALVDRGVKAASLDSTLLPGQATFVKDEVLSGSIKILYVAPERLNNEGFMHMMSRVTISLLAVDEAHCISQWGASFRPEYLKIARFAQEQNVERVLCLTATATPAVSKDICKAFCISQEGVFRTPVFRPNLSLRVEVAHTLEKKSARLVSLLEQCSGPSIVYVTLQRHAEEVANQLLTRGFNAMVYHAGLPTEKRTKVQLDFMASNSAVVVCTIAFGMGIDKANIRQIIHLYMPKTVENYSQEVGRAGRDGLQSTCVMFLASSDIPTLEGFCRGDTCSEKNLQLWLQEVVTKQPAKDGTLDFNHYKQSKDYDIRQNTLGLCYAQLELDYGLIRAVTPFFSIYEISPCSASFSATLSSKNATITAIKTHCRRKGNKYEIDVVEASEASGIERADLARQISDWELDGIITSKASQIRARYTVLKELPVTSEAIKKVAGDIYLRMLEREEEGIEKLRQVVAFATDDDCLAHNLAKYFGDEDAVPDAMCKHCTFCATGQSVDFEMTSSAAVDTAQIQAILAACPERDDPRLLARMAFGITSPRLTVNKWSTSHPLFGSMVTSDFNALVKAFDEECKKAGYQGVTNTSVTNKKRSYSSYSGSTSGGRGRGGGGKRGRT